MICLVFSSFIVTQIHECLIFSYVWGYECILFQFYFNEGIYQMFELKYGRQIYFYHIYCIFALNNNLLCNDHLNKYNVRPVFHLHKYAYRYYMAVFHFLLHYHNTHCRFHLQNYVFLSSNICFYLIQISIILSL